MLNVEILIEALENIERIYQSNQLAYLTLTKKNEHIIQDNVSLYLDEHLKNSIVSREYIRADIAILESNKICDLIELKSMYLHDSVKSKVDFIDVIKHDFQKNDKMLVNYIIQKFCILTVVEVIGDNIPPLYNKIIKYAGDINRFQKLYTNKNMLDEYERLINLNFNNSEYEYEKTSIQAGQKYGLDVILHFWVIEKKESL